MRRPSRSGTTETEASSVAKKISSSAILEASASDQGACGTPAAAPPRRAASRTPTSSGAAPERSAIPTPRAMRWIKRSLLRRSSSAARRHRLERAARGSGTLLRVATEAWARPLRAGGGLSEPAADRGAPEQADQPLHAGVALHRVGVGAARGAAAEAVDQDRELVAVAAHAGGAVHDAD